MALIIVAVALSLLIGVSLGLLGGGGSILTVPIMIYALGIEEKSAIASSLIVVGATSAVAVIAHARAGNVVWRTALIFAGAGMAGAFLGGKVARFLPSSLLLVLFAVIMFATAFFMWKGRKPSPNTEVKQGPLPLPTILLEGLVVGLVTGLVGAGGGFLVVPALALLGGLPMQKAVGSSLVVIALKSFAGFAGYASHVEFNWTMTGIVTAAAIVGSFGGAALAKKVPQEQLRKGFAVFVLVMAVFLLGKQVQAWVNKADAPEATSAAQHDKTSALPLTTTTTTTTTTTAEAAAPTVDGQGIQLLKLGRDPDLAAGQKVYEGRCLACHGAEGKGVVAENVVAFPPLWGERSFNIAAGMARLHTAAGFIHDHMPLGQGGTLSADEAYDVAGYVTQMPRPDFLARASDWPQGGKPTDARD